MAPRFFCKLTPHGTRTRQANAAYLRVLNEFISNLIASSGSVRDEIQYPFRKTSFMKDLCNHNATCCR